jgi:RNA polymerase sigma-70 factor (ECF subfamily)
MKWRPLTERERGVPVPVAGTFEQLIMPHLDAAYNLARWLMQDVTAAEDVVQDAVLRALTYFGSYKGGNARAWFLRVVRNVAYGALAAQRRGGTTSLDDAGLTAEGNPFAMEIADPGDDPEVTLARSEGFVRLDQALAALPEELRECLVLHELEEFSYKEVAHITDVPIGTSSIPSFHSREKFAKQAAAEQHFRESLHQRQQPMFGHVRDQFVEHAPLAEQRVRARL